MAWSRDCGEVLEETVKRVTFLNVIQQCLYRDTSARETGSTMHDPGINRNHTGGVHFFLNGHNSNISLKDGGTQVEIRREHHSITSIFQPPRASTGAWGYLGRVPLPNYWPKATRDPDPGGTLVYVTSCPGVAARARKAASERKVVPLLAKKLPELGSYR